MARHNSIMDPNGLGYEKLVLGGKMERTIRIPKTPELVEKLKPLWDEAKEVEMDFRVRLAEIESRMYDETKIEGIEFFFCNGEVVGIGNYQRSMELIHDSDLIE